MSNNEETRAWMVTMLQQIGVGNLLAISGGRHAVINDTTLGLPVARGYWVEIEYKHGTDTYTVRRARFVNGERKEHGEIPEVHFPELGELAYRASCFESYDKDEWLVIA